MLPLAWIAYQWLGEVRRHRTVELALHLMSLPMLNEHQSISLGYRQLSPTPGGRLGWRQRPSSSMAPTPCHRSMRQWLAGSSAEPIITG